MTTPAFPTGTILGYPRIGRRRELKKAVEAFWAGTHRRRRARGDRRRTARGDPRAPGRRSGSGATDSSIPEASRYYDQVLDAAVTVGAIPARFADLVG